MEENLIPRVQTVARQHPATSAVAAPCEVTCRWLGFHRIWHGSGEVFDTVDLFLPDVQFTTQVRLLLPPRIKTVCCSVRDKCFSGIQSVSVGHKSVQCPLY